MLELHRYWLVDPNWQRQRFDQLKPIAGLFIFRGATSVREQPTPTCAEGDQCPWASERRRQLRFAIAQRRIQLRSDQKDTCGEISPPKVGAAEAGQRI
jgi:hypothetical protein